MSKLIQMDLFGKDAFSEIQDLRNSQNNLRKGIFKRHDALLKLITSLSDEVLLLKEEIYELRQDQMVKYQDMFRIHPQEIQA